MNEIVACYHMPSHPLTDSVVLRAGTVVWREGRNLVVVSARGSRTIPADWPLYSHELSHNGEFVLALGDDARRGAVWECHTGRQIMNIVGDETKRQSLRAGLAAIGDQLFVIIAVRNRDMSIRTVPDGTEQGWICATGVIWFQVLNFVHLHGQWLAIHGYHGDDQYNTVAAIPLLEALQDPMALYGALTEQPCIKEWGYRVAIGPAGQTQAVVFRDPEWDDDDPSNNSTESFCGFIVYDLESKNVIQRIAYEGEIKDGAIIGANDERVAFEAEGGVILVSRVTGRVRRIEGTALDPYRLIIARMDGNTISIVKI